MVDEKRSKECKANGKNMKDTAWMVSKWANLAKLAPKIIAEIISAVIDSNKSAAWPAQSPTLSPTRSAITAGFLSSSYGKSF